MTDTRTPATRLPEDKRLAEELVERAKNEGVELVGPDGLLAGLTKDVLEAGLEAEMSEHLGYDKHDPVGRDKGNSRNGTRAKKLLTDVGPVDIEVPRDRDGSFEPQLVKKRQRRLWFGTCLVGSVAASVRRTAPWQRYGKRRPPCSESHGTATTRRPSRCPSVSARPHRRFSRLPPPLRRPHNDPMVDVNTIVGIGPVARTVLEQLCCDARSARFVTAGRSVIVDMGRPVRVATRRNAKPRRYGIGSAVSPLQSATPMVHHPPHRWLARITR